MSIAHLVAMQGRRQEARAMLSKVYNWFTEGCDAADLKEAKALLDELSRKSVGTAQQSTSIARELINSLRA